jgi:hypothetical protein
VLWLAPLQVRKANRAGSSSGSEALGSKVAGSSRERRTGSPLSVLVMNLGEPEARWINSKQMSGLAARR